MAKKKEVSVGMGFDKGMDQAPMGLDAPIEDLIHWARTEEKKGLFKTALPKDDEELKKKIYQARSNLKSGKGKPKGKRGRKAKTTSSNGTGALQAIISLVQEHGKEEIKKIVDMV